MRTPIGIFVLLAATTALLALPAFAAPPPGSGTYEGPGTIVIKDSIPGAASPPTIADNGAVVCQDTNGDGIPDHGRGGVCLRFADLPSAADSIYVHDASVADSALAFQVCIDNNGDGICQGGGGDGAGGRGCDDIIFFSHSTSGANYNPLWIPRGWVEQQWASCGGAGFPGYVVITCAGVHGTGLSAHTHDVTSGTVKPVFTGGTSKGDFCGAPTAAKAYVVV